MVLIKADGDILYTSRGMRNPGIELQRIEDERADFTFCSGIVDNTPSFHYRKGSSNAHRILTFCASKIFELSQAVSQPSVFRVQLLVHALVFWEEFLQKKLVFTLHD